MIEVWINQIRKRRAYNRLSKDPYVFVGARMVRVKGSGDVPIIDAACYISHLSFGRMEVTVEDSNSDENGCVYTFTGREFEALIPIFKT